MDRCFIIQPFDKGPFDKRFQDVFKPAVQKAGLDPYRVDKDPSVSIPIEEIEAGIRSSRACLADITQDNPNVWFELGIAIATQKEVCLVCSDERKTPFPFDVQHRSIIRYSTQSPSDFTKLEQEITERLKAILTKRQELQAVASLSPTTETEGLAPHEIAVLLALMKRRVVTPDYQLGWQLRQDLTQAGFSEVAAGIAVEALVRKHLVISMKYEDREEGWVYMYGITPDGVEWVLRNTNKIQMRQPGPPPGEDNSIPF